MDQIIRREVAPDVLQCAIKGGELVGGIVAPDDHADDTATRSPGSRCSSTNDAGSALSTTTVVRSTPGAWCAKRSAISASARAYCSVPNRAKIVSSFIGWRTEPGWGSRCYTGDGAVVPTRGRTDNRRKHVEPHPRRTHRAFVCSPTRPGSGMSIRPTQAVGIRAGVLPRARRRAVPATAHGRWRWFGPPLSRGAGPLRAPRDLACGSGSGAAGSHGVSHRRRGPRVTAHPGETRGIGRHSGCPPGGTRRR